MDVKKVKAIKEWALKNYEKNWGASEIIECFDDEGIDSEFDSLRDAKNYAKLRGEKHDEFQDY